MIAQLLNIPATPREWDIWSYHHRLSHDAIAQAVLRQKSINLTDFIIDPIPQTAFVDWLARNQQLHIEMDAAVGAQSIDLQDLDPTDKNQMVAWIYDHWQEHVTAETRLGIGS